MIRLSPLEALHLELATRIFYRIDRKFLLPASSCASGAATNGSAFSEEDAIEWARRTAGQQFYTSSNQGIGDRFSTKEGNPSAVAPSSSANKANLRTIDDTPSKLSGLRTEAARGSSGDGVEASGRREESCSAQGADSEAVGQPAMDDGVANVGGEYSKAVIDGERVGRRGSQERLAIVDIRFIKLTQGVFAIVDPVDVERLSQFRWRLERKRDGRKYALTGSAATIRMHRMVVDAHDLVVDHRDGYGLDNRRSNLRECTNAQNIQNMRPKKPGLKGVYKTTHGKSPWMSSITVSGKCVYLGRFASEAEAGQAYDAAAEFYFGEFARLNSPTSRERPATIFNRLRALAAQIGGSIDAFEEVGRG